MSDAAIWFLIGVVVGTAICIFTLWMDNKKYH